MTDTPNLGLHTWAPEDPVDVAQINENFRAIDQNRADVAQCLNALAASIGSGGSTCRIAFGTYAGTGAAGEAHPNILGFDFTPLMLVISNASSANGHHFAVSIYGPGVGTVDGTNPCVFDWRARSVSWYSEDSVAARQANYNGYQYKYLVLGVSDLQE